MTIRDLSVDFRTPRGNVHAIRGVNVDVPEGKILGIVGESGSGKSTLIWAMTRLLPSNAIVRSGQIRFKGEDVLAYSERDLERYRGAQVAIVFQDPMTSQMPVISYERQMADIQYRRRDTNACEKKRAAINAMRRVGIADPERRLGQFPHQFSGGMRQRISIAMALLMKPPLLIADEPTTALDVTMEAQIIHLMRSLKEELQATLIVVSHNLGLIAELCDEVAVMYAGEVVEHGSVDRIFYEPKHPYTMALLACDPARLPELTRKLPTIPGEVPDLRNAPIGCAFAPRCPNAFFRCRQEAPQVHESRGGQAARCHLLDPRCGQDGRVARRRPDGDRCEAAKPADSAAPLRRSLGAARLLEVDSVRVRYRTMGAMHALLAGVSDPYIDAVLDVSLSLQAGETLGLVGESGSGKTTLGRAILGLVSAWSGSVRFDGKELIGLSSAKFIPLRRHMAMMFQDPVGSLSPRKTVRSLLTEPFDIHGVERCDDESEAARLCDMVGLPRDLLSRYPHELSGGQARRVGIARALSLQPRLIIADEPTAGLDVSVQGEILNLMIELQLQHELAYLVITHNLPVVRHISDRLAIMYLGRIVEQGDSKDVYARPAHPYTDALVKGVPQPDPAKRRRLVSIEGEIPSLVNRPQGCEFHTRCPHAKAQCRMEQPALRSLLNGRKVRCHFPLID